MEALIIGYIIMWTACGITSYGVSYAYFLRRWSPLPEARIFHLMWVLWGPFDLFLTLRFLARENGDCDTFRYGFKL